MQPFIWNPWLSAWRTPDRPAVIAADQSLSFADLTRTADRLGAGLRVCGVPDGAVLSTDIPAGPRLFALVLAALRHGYGLFPVSASALARPHGDRLLAESGSVLHVGESEGERRPTRSFDELTQAAMSTSGLRVAGHLQDRAGHLLFSTSGTTGEPTVARQARPRRAYRGVAVTARYASGPDCGPHVMANPAFHLGTIGPALYALQAGSAVVVQQDRTPGDFVALVDQHSADTAFLSPDQLVELVGAGLRPRRNLAVVFHGGAPCAPAVKRAGIALLGPVLHEYYGISQCVVSEIDASDWLDNPGSVGRPLPGLDVRIESGGAPVPPGTLGEVHVRPRRASRTDPRLSIRTGDVGYVRSDGYLFVIGRTTGPRSPESVGLEHAIRHLPGVADVVVVAGATRWTCHVEATPSPSTGGDLSGQIRALAAAYTPSRVELDLCPVGSLPRTASGKLHRTKLGRGTK